MDASGFRRNNNSTVTLGNERKDVVTFSNPATVASAPVDPSGFGFGFFFFFVPTSRHPPPFPNPHPYRGRTLRPRADPDRRDPTGRPFRRRRCRRYVRISDSVPRDAFALAPRGVSQRGRRILPTVVVNARHRRHRRRNNYAARTITIIRQ